MKTLLVLLLIAFTCYLANKSGGIIPEKTITLVRFKDTIYHCEEIKTTPCGYYLSCGKMAIHCATNITTEIVKL